MFFSDDDKSHFKNIFNIATEDFLEDMINNCIKKEPQCDYKNIEEINEYVDRYEYLSVLFISGGQEKVLFEIG